MSLTHRISLHQWSFFRVLGAITLILVTVGRASAHAEVVRSEPAADVVLPTAPARVTLYFSQLLEPIGNRLAIVNAGGTTVSTGEAVLLPNDAKALQVALQPDLAPGRYTIQYTTLSAEDGEEHSGELAFTLAGADTAPGGDTASSTPAASGSAVPAAPAPLPATVGTDAGVLALLLVALLFLFSGSLFRYVPSVRMLLVPRRAKRWERRV